MTPEIAAQIGSAIGGPGLVVFLWFYFNKQKSDEKKDPINEIAVDMREIREALAEIEKGMAVLLDRGKK